MTPDQLRALKPGNLVRAAVPVSGDVNDMTIGLPGGAIAKVDRVDPSGATLVFDNGIVNVFDDSEAWMLDLVEDSDDVTLERIHLLLNHSPRGYPASELVGDVDYIRTGERS